jgi:hypothetical protein
LLDQRESRVVHGVLEGEFAPESDDDHLVFFLLPSGAASSPDELVLASCPSTSSAVGSGRVELVFVSAPADASPQALSVDLVMWRVYFHLSHFSVDRLVAGKRYFEMIRVNHGSKL